MCVPTAREETSNFVGQTGMLVPLLTIAALPRGVQPCSRQASQFSHEIISTQNPPPCMARSRPQLQKWCRWGVAWGAEGVKIG